MNTKEEEKKTVTLSEKQFNILINEISSLKKQVEELSSKPTTSSRPPVFYSGGNPSKTKDLLQSEKREAILSGDKMQRAIDTLLADIKRHPPRRF